MKLHANARLTVKGRQLLVDRLDAGWSLTEAALAAGVSERTARKWRDRHRAGGVDGLVDRSSAPRSMPARTPEDRIEAIAALRRLRFTGAEIAESLDMAASTVSGILTRIGMGKLGRLGLEPAQRYERERPGELVHIDVKKLGRIQGGAGKRVRGPRKHYNRTFIDRDGKRRHTVGWEFVHVAIDDATRLAYVDVLADVTAPTAVAFILRRPRHPRQTRHDRQRRRLPLNDPRTRLSRARPAPPAHARLPPANQRQSRALHPHHARRLGLRRDLPRQLRTHRRPLRMA
jgi:transposase